MDELDKALEAAIDSVGAAAADSGDGAPATPNTPAAGEGEPAAPSAQAPEDGAGEGEAGKPPSGRSAAAARARDESGRFTPKDSTTASPAPVKPGEAPPAKDAAGAAPQGAPAKAADTKAPTTPGAGEQPPAADQPEVVEGRDITKPPSTWKAEAAADFNKLPRAVRAEIHRREESMFRGIEQYKTAAKFGSDVATICKPFQPMLEATQIAPTEVLNAGLRFEYLMRTGSPEQKRDFMHNLAKSYGVELAQPVDENGQPIVPQPPAAEVVALQQQVADLSRRLAARDQADSAAAQRAEQEQVADIRKQIADFAADPKNEFYSDVREDMLKLITSGQASGLRDAYDNAIWANPVTRAKLIARQQEAERKEAAERAAAANKANQVNVTPRATPQGKTAGKGTLDNVLGSEIDRALARSA